MKLQHHLSIRRILVLVSLLFLLLPVGSIYFLRIYESALIRQTESELIAQGAFVSAMYKQAISQELSRKGIEPAHYGLPLPLKLKPDSEIDPVLPHLDLAQDRIFSARPTPLYTSDRLDPLADEAGRQISPVLKNGQRITLSGIKVLDYQGLVVAGQEERGLSFAHTEEFQKARGGKPISLLRLRRMPAGQASLSSVSRNATINVFVALPVALQDRLIGVIWLNRTPMDLTQALYGKRQDLFWTGLALLLTAMLITLLTSLTITRPIRALVRKTRLIAQGHPDGLKPLEHPITREIWELSENVARMAQTIQHRSEYIRNFTTHVSHEFKTPLTAIRGSIELLQDNLDEMPREQQRRFLDNISADTNRLSLLVSRLLELAKADMTDAARQQSDMLPILKQYSMQEAVTIHLPEDTETLIVPISSESLEALLNNLIENSRQAGATEVAITLNLEKTRVLLDVRDNGPGISEANQKNIFTPFFTTRRGQGGTGLGLSISQSLLERYGGRIYYIPSDSGACFRLDLPRL